MPTDTPSPYGYCPQCGGLGRSRERRLHGNDRCENGHIYPSANAVKNPLAPRPEAPVPLPTVNVCTTTPELTDLARRAVACKKWRWLPGMKDLEGWRLHRELPLGGWDAIGGEWEYHQVTHYPKLPDLTDPATVGCLLALVREAWGRVVVTSPDYDYDDEVQQGPHIIGWRAVETARWTTVGKGVTEAEALVAALEAAPVLGG